MYDNYFEEIQIQIKLPNKCENECFKVDAQTLGGSWEDDLEHRTLQYYYSAHLPCRLMTFRYILRKLNNFPFMYTFRYLRL